MDSFDTSSSFCDTPIDDVASGSWCYLHSNDCDARSEENVLPTDKRISVQRIEVNATSNPDASSKDDVSVSVDENPGWSTQGECCGHPIEPAMHALIKKTSAFFENLFA